MPIQGLLDLQNPPEFEWAAWNPASPTLMDHRGRILAFESDGQGRLHICTNHADLETLADGETSRSSPSNFQSWCQATLGSPEPFFGYAAKGNWTVPQRAPAPSSHESGAGWVQWNGSRIILDDSHQALEWPTLEVPMWLPYWDGFESEIPLPAVCSDLTCERLGWLDARRKGGLDWKAINCSEPVAAASQFPDGALHAGVVVSHLNPASFEVSLPTGTAALRLTKVYDAFHGRQRARVIVDGEPAGLWSVMAQDRVSRWRRSSYFLGTRWVEGKDRVRIELDPPAGSPLWSFSQLDVTAYIVG